MEIRNIAIIAHVDHGKTTLVDGLLKQSKTFRDNEALMTKELIMDSNDQERERGITILAKNTAITYKGVKINIIDTPGHADFGGEVERTLNMADGALLLVDAQEGPMPQTKFVLKKAMDLGLKIIIIINKIDKKDSRTKDSLRKVHDLILELAKNETDLDAPVVYSIGRDAKSWNDMPDDFTASADLSPILDAILKHIPAPEVDNQAPFQMLISTLDWDNYKGIYAIGRVRRGSVSPGQKVALLKADGSNEVATVENVYVNQGLKRVEASEEVSGDIIAITGIKNACIGDTLTDINCQEALPTIMIEEPTLSMSIGPNTSPFMGKEGKFFTGRQIKDRIERELQVNVAMKFMITEEGQYIISGRGELHLSVFLENLRREGFEMEVGKPKVITRIVDGVEMEPVEEVIVDVDSAHVGAVKSEIGSRRGVLLMQEETTSKSSRLVFELTTRGILGLKGALLTLSKGTAVLSSSFLRYEKKGAEFQKMRRGALIASVTGKTAAFGLAVAQDKGPIFVGPQVQVYEGMIVGINGRDEDMEINVCKEKQLTNNRSVGEDATILTPPLNFSLEQYIGFLGDDELLEITPKNLRLRKAILDKTTRYRTSKRS